MILETFIAIVCLVGLVVSCVGYSYFNENVRVTYKECKIPQKKKGAKK